MKLAIILVHNKSDLENQAQITALKSLLTEVVDGPFLNEETGETWTTIHHEIIGLDIPHEVRVYQVIPFGVEAPTNRYEVNSGGIVYYEKGDEDKKGDHPRFFNWGLKRGTDNGADISIYVENIKKFNIEDLTIQLNSLVDPDDKHEYTEDQSVKIATLKLLKEVGQLDEGRNMKEAIENLKQRNIGKGNRNG